MSKSKQETKSSQTTNQTATTTPNTPSWLQQPWQDYTGKVTDLMNSGQSLVAGPSDLQNQAFQGAANLAPSQNFDWATQLGLKAGTAGANTATATGYQGQGYTAAQGQAQGYNPNTVDWSKFGVEGVNVGPMAQGSSRSITDLDLNSYLNAGLGDQITATQADYDATGGRVRAAQSGQAALNGGSRNSNNAIQSAITEGELSRAANTGIANVRANAYDQAGNLATNDLNREASMSQFNAGQTNQGTLTQAQLNAQRNSLEAQLGQTGLLANQNAMNQAGQFNAGAANQFGLANMDSLNQAGQFGANAQNQANQFNATAQNQNSQFNAGQQDGALERMLQSAGLLSNIGSAQGADQRANVALQGDLGQTQRDITNQTSQASNLAMIQALLSGVPLNAFVGQTSTGNSTSNGTNTTTNTPSLMSQIGQGASTAAAVAALFSDRRLKADIEPTRKDGRGRQWYRYRYLWDQPGTVHEGVMAQEIIATDPQAVGERGGFMTVNYSMLEAA